MEHFLIAFLLAAVVYGVAFYAMENHHTRTTVRDFTGAGGTNFVPHHQRSRAQPAALFSRHLALYTNGHLVFDQPREVPSDALRQMWMPWTPRGCRAR